MVASTRRLMLLVALVATMLACMVPVTTAQSYNADHERANSEFQAQIDKEKKDYQRNLETKEKAKKSKLAEKEAKKAHEAAKKLDDKIEKRKNIGAPTARPPRPRMLATLPRHRDVVKPYCTPQTQTMQRRGRLRCAAGRCPTPTRLRSTARGRPLRKRPMRRLKSKRGTRSFELL
mmetsp:Transcript_97680/g.279379  ORF Transcript_97680/g.279379 Transcript_97680/m.279379 type:complete len:176 (-) Transcript_97680:210-737(-)